MKTYFAYAAYQNIPVLKKQVLILNCIYHYETS